MSPELFGALMVAGMVASGLRDYARGRPEEGQSALLLGLLAGAVAVFGSLAPVTWLAPAVFAGECCVAVLEAGTLITWFRRRDLAGPTVHRVEGARMRWPGRAIIASGAAAGVAADLMGASIPGDVLLLAVIAVLSTIISVIEGKVGTQITQNGLLQGTRFTPWSSITSAHQDEDGLLLYTRRRLASWLGFGWRRIRGTESSLAVVLDHAKRNTLPGVT